MQGRSTSTILAVGFHGLTMAQNHSADSPVKEGVQWAAAVDAGAVDVGTSVDQQPGDVVVTRVRYGKVERRSRTFVRLPFRWNGC